MKEKQDSFSLNYSAAHRTEVEQIREKYVETQKTDLGELRRLDAWVTSAATFAAIGVGIGGLLFLGSGLSLSLGFGRYVLGMVLCGVGLVIMGGGLLVHKLVLNRMKKKYAPRILELSDKLLKINKTEIF
ncbi:MAG: hypothetical protein IKW26_05095 [Treponema sp.]|nr:hypothetical protein [Treponema sp.]